MSARYSSCRGSSLVELLFILKVLGLLASLVVPKVSCQISGSEYSLVRLQHAMVRAGIDSFVSDVGRLPDGVEELVEQPSGVEFWSGPYIKTSALKDPWGNAWVYRRPGEHGKYDLLSYGEDGSPGGEGTNSDINSWE